MTENNDELSVSISFAQDSDGDPFFPHTRTGRYIYGAALLGTAVMFAALSMFVSWWCGVNPRKAIVVVWVVYTVSCFTHPILDWVMKTARRDGIRFTWRGSN